VRVTDEGHHPGCPRAGHDDIASGHQIRDNAAVVETGFPREITAAIIATAKASRVQREPRAAIGVSKTIAGSPSS
jgi:hypothetical protein